MTEGNSSVNITLSKTQLVIERGFGLTIPQQASKHGLSTSQMKSALEDCGIIKGKDGSEPVGELTEREQKLLDTCVVHQVEPSTFNAMLADLGMEYKTGRRSTKGGKKYVIIDDLTVATVVTKEVTEG